VKKKVSIMEVYERLIGTHPDCNGYQQYAEEIACKLGVSPAYISKLIKKLKDGGFIAPSGKRTSQIYYSPTKRKFQNEKLTKSCDHVGVGTFCCSSSQWSCPVDKLPPETCLKGWEKRNMANGVVQYLLRYPFVKPADGSLKFRIMGKYKFTISVDFTGLNLSENEILESDKYPAFLEEFVKSALLWVKRKFNIAMDVNNVRLSTEPHFETEERDADAKKYVETARITIEFSDGRKIMINRSGGKDNFETNFPPWLKEYVDLPSYRERFYNMEEKQIPRILRIEDKLERIIEMFGREKIGDMKREKENLERGVIY